MGGVLIGTGCGHFRTTEDGYCVDCKSSPAVVIEELRASAQKLDNELDRAIPMLLWCPGCGERHIDEGSYASRPHHTHACQNCGLVWRPAVVATVGVRFLPGFNNER